MFMNHCSGGGEDISDIPNKSVKKNCDSPRLRSQISSTPSPTTKGEKEFDPKNRRFLPPQTKINKKTYKPLTHKCLNAF